MERAVFLFVTPVLFPVWRVRISAVLWVKVRSKSHSPGLNTSYFECTSVQSALKPRRRKKKRAVLFARSKRSKSLVWNDRHFTPLMNVIRRRSYVTALQLSKWQQGVLTTWWHVSCLYMYIYFWQIATVSNVCWFCIDRITLASASYCAMAAHFIQALWCHLVCDKWLSLP